METNDLIVVCGGGGFIGGHLVSKLLSGGHTRIRSVDIKDFGSWHQRFPEVENIRLDLSRIEDCHRALKGADIAFNLAADMGGMGFIENNKALCMLSVLINTHLLVAAREHHLKRYFYASSACVYASSQQNVPLNPGLKESDAYPASPEDGYGWEKLFGERMCRHFHEDFGVETRVARYHNVYGPFGTFDGGREKVPAALCRKVIQAKLSGRLSVEIWGDGEQTRSFTFVDDCVIGTRKLVASEVYEPLNVGSSEMVSINKLLDIIEEIGGVRLTRKYLPDAPKGVRGRNSDNTLIKKLLDWEPSTPLKTGIEITYAWIYDQIRNGVGSSC